MLVLFYVMHVLAVKLVHAYPPVQSRSKYTRVRTLNHNSVFVGSRANGGMQLHTAREQPTAVYASACANTSVPQVTAAVHFAFIAFFIAFFGASACAFAAFIAFMARSKCDTPLQEVWLLSLGIAWSKWP